MMPFHPSYRSLLRKYIPQISNVDLDRHESLMALRLQLILERNMRPEDRESGHSQTQGNSARNLRNELIREATIEANGTDKTGIFSGFERELNAVHQLWIARRQLLLIRSPYPQASSSQRGLANQLRSVLRYYVVRLETFPVLAMNRLMFFRGRIIAILIVLLLAGLAIWHTAPGRGREVPQGQIGAEPKDGRSRF
jgi:hypothetical protein